MGSFSLSLPSIAISFTRSSLIFVLCLHRGPLDTTNAGSPPTLPSTQCWRGIYSFHCFLAFLLAIKRMMTSGSRYISPLHASTHTEQSRAEHPTLRSFFYSLPEMCVGGQPISDDRNATSSSSPAPVLCCS